MMALFGLACPAKYCFLILVSNLLAVEAIRIEQISKRYQQVEVLKRVSFSVAPGELFGLIGPDGAGKSTLFRVLTTLLHADEGQAWVAGHPVVEEYKWIRQKVGYMPGRFSLYQDLSIEENLEFFATVFGTTVQENYDLIRDIYVQIEPFKKRLAGQLSGGMKQKLALCCALIHKPEVLFLDEPTTGVDAVSRKEFWEMLQKLKTRGIGILVSTPYMDEASLCDRIALIQEGKILNINSPQSMVATFAGPLYAITGNNLYPLLKALRLQPFSKSVLPFGDSLHLTVKEGVDEDTIRQFLQSSGFDSATFRQIAPGIEDIFLELSQKVRA